MRRRITSNQNSTAGSLAQGPEISSSWKMLVQAMVALLVSFGGEFLLDTGVSALFGADPCVTRKLLFLPLSLLPRTVVLLLIYWDREPWRKYVGELSRTTWLYAAGGIVFVSGGLSLMEGGGFPQVAAEFRYMMDLANGALPLALLLMAGQILYYAVEGAVKIYVIVKGSEAVEGWQPSFSPWLAGVCAGLLLGLTWGLIHIVSQGSIMAGLAGLILSIPLGFLYGKAQAGLVPWLTWMSLMIL